MVGADSGIGGGSSMDIGTALAITSFVAIALYNVVELNFIIFATFKKKRGLYFWSFLGATWSIAPYAVGFLIKGLQLSTVSIFYVTLIVVGWIGMVTGQSVVLYSRLHLVERNRTRLRLVLAMILVNAVVCHTPIVVMVYGANSANPDPYIVPYSIYEKVQVSIFFVQELVISGLYIASTIHIFRLDSALLHGGRSAGRTLRHLIWVNVVIICLDITILGLEYAGYYDLQTAYKALVYSAKLKMEFSILNSLIDLTKARGGAASASAGNYHHHNNNNNNNNSSSRGDRSRPDALGTVELDKLKGGNGGGSGGGRAHRHASSLCGPSPGYNAFARAEVSGGAVGVGAGRLHGLQTSSSQHGIMVTKTTEVNAVQDLDGGRSNRAPSEQGTDRDSLDISTPELHAKSSSSSEVGFAKSAF